MSNKLYFTYDETHGDFVPFLWNDELKGAPRNAHLVQDEETYEKFLRDAMGAGNRTRSLLLVDTEAAAKVLTRQLMADENASCIITDLGEDRYCVGATLFSGSYDDGIPLISILTDGNTDFDLDPALEEFTSIFDASSDEYKTAITITAEEPSMDFA